MRTRHRITRISEINRVTTVASNSPLLLPSNILIHARHPGINRVAEQIFSYIMDMFGPFLYLRRLAYWTICLNKGETHSLLFGFYVSYVLTS